MKRTTIFFSCLSNALLTILFALLAFGLIGQAICVMLSIDSFWPFCAVLVAAAMAVPTMIVYIETSDRKANSNPNL
jgi:hypothetical protein